MRSISSFFVLAFQILIPSLPSFAAPEWEPLFRFSIEWMRPVSDANRALDRVPDATGLIDFSDLLGIQKEWVHGTPTPTPSPTPTPEPGPRLVADLLSISGARPSLAAYPNGDYLAGYERSSRQRLQRFNADGSRDGDEVKLETGTQLGDLFVDRWDNAWIAYEYDGSAYHEIRLYHEDFPERIYQVTETVPGLANDQRYPAIAVDSDRYAAMVWEDQGSDPVQVILGFARYLNDTDGIELLSLIYLSNNTDDRQETPDIAVNASGEFLAVWTRKKKEINAHFFKRQGQWEFDPGDDFTVSTSAELKLQPRVATLGDSFLAVWENTASLSQGQIDSRLVLGRESFGAAETRIDDSPAGARLPAVAALRGLSPDRYLVVWVDGRDGGGWIRGRLLDSAGVPAGPSFPLVQAVGEVARLEVAGSREGDDFRREILSSSGRKREGFVPCFSGSRNSPDRI
jgi:hypothetical protein